jgi:hypothetical protein
MIEYLFAAGQWLGAVALLYGACLVVVCASDDLRDTRTRFGPLTTHDWDAPHKSLEMRRQRAQW